MSGHGGGGGRDFTHFCRKAIQWKQKCKGEAGRCTVDFKVERDFSGQGFDWNKQTNKTVATANISVTIMSEGFFSWYRRMIFLQKTARWTVPGTELKRLATHHHKVIGLTWWRVG